CRQAPAPTQVDWLLFGSPAQLEIRGLPEDVARERADAVAAGLAPLHAAWHPWQDSALSRLNQALARGEAVTLPPLLAWPLARSRPLHQASDGLFDPASGGLVALWGFHTG